MKLSLQVSKKWIDFLDGLTTLNANDVMWQWLEVYLDRPLTIQQSLWVTYTNAKFGEHTHEVLFAEDGTNKYAKMHIPPEVIKIAGEWQIQLFIRQYSITDPSKYTQVATNKPTFTVADGLPLDEDGTPVNNETIASLYEKAKNIINTIQSNNVIFQKTVSATDSGWEEVDGEWRYGVLKSEHLLDSIYSVNAEKETSVGIFENIWYSFKKYLTGTVYIILDEKINMKITIQGNKEVSE